MEKSPEAFRTIREVADAMDLPQHVLRFWETRFPQIRPLKRAGGRRYYRPEDVERLRVIKRLLYEEGYTIKGVQKLFKEQGAQALTSGGFTPRPPLSFARDLEFAPTPERIDPALVATADEDESLPLAPDEALAALHSRSLPPEDLESLREALADIRHAERLLQQVRVQDG